ncbi:hypothetical protein D9M68_129410 [compost metagenome]
MTDEGGTENRVAFAHRQTDGVPGQYAVRHGRLRRPSKEVGRIGAPVTGGPFCRIQFA